MRAIVFDKELKFVADYKKPILQNGEALIKINLAGICNTDIELTKGYMGFNGVLGHEFVGEVVEVNAEDKTLLGKRVVGEINLGCEACEYCLKGLQRHCPNRTVLGIFNKDGCLADYISMPIQNLICVNDISDEKAVFTEPIAAAFEILEQLHIQPNHKVAVLGDGKLGILIAKVLGLSYSDLVLVGKHESKLAIARDYGIKTAKLPSLEEKRIFDIVVDATGSISGIETAMKLLKPRGTLVLKSTVATGKDFNLSPFVVDEITILGSRCGRFEPAVRFLKDFDTTKLIEATFGADDAMGAFERAKTKGALKVLVDFKNRLEG